MNITPANISTLRYPSAAVLAMAAALATPACLQQQQQMGGTPPADILPLTIVECDANGKPLRTTETTLGEWEKGKKTGAAPNLLMD